MLYPNIRALREDRDLRQRQLAELLNVSQNTYSQYESGVIALTAEHLIKLADFYHVSVDYLLGRTDKREMNQYKRTARGRFFSYIRIWPRQSSGHVG